MAGVTYFPYPAGGAVRPDTVFAHPGLVRTMLDADSDDDAIIRRVLAGETEAFAGLIDKYGSAINKQMRNYAENYRTAEELAHEVFVEAFLNLAKFRGDAPFGHWLSRIATFTGYKHWQRRGKRRREVEFSDERDSVPSEADSPELPKGNFPAAESTEKRAEQARRLVCEMLAALPDNDRLVLTLSCLENCSHGEIAARLGWSKPLIAMRLFKAKGKLRKLAGREPWKGRVACIIS